MLAGAVVAASSALAAEVTPERLINADREPVPCQSGAGHGDQSGAGHGDQEEVRRHKVRYYPEQRDPSQEPVVHTWTHKLDKAA
jgi:hypothetical protein